MILMGESIRQIWVNMLGVNLWSTALKIEPPCEKTGLLGFHPGLSQKKAGSLKFQIEEEEGMYYP